MHAVRLPASIFVHAAAQWSLLCNGWSGLSLLGQKILKRDSILHLQYNQPAKYAPVALCLPLRSTLECRTGKADANILARKCGKVWFYADLLIPAMFLDISVSSISAPASVLAGISRNLTYIGFHANTQGVNNREWQIWGIEWHGETLIRNTNAAENDLAELSHLHWLPCFVIHVISINLHL